MLARQGSPVIRKANQSTKTYLRYYEPGATGQMVQRSIYIGSEPELVLRVKGRLRELRAPEQELEQVLELVRVARALVTVGRRLGLQR